MSPTRPVHARRSLHELADALLAINSTRSTGEVVSALTTHAEAILDAAWASCSLGSRPVGPPLQDGRLSADLVAQDGALLGAITVGAKEGRTFDDDDHAILIQLGRIASSALERAQLQSKLERRLEQLQGLAEAAVAVNSPLTTEQVLDRLTNAAAEIVGAHVAVTDYRGGGEWAQTHTALHLSEQYRARGRQPLEPTGPAVAEVLANNASVRRTEAELAQERAATDGDLPCRGLLATALVSRDGGNLGLIYLCDKTDGTDFSAEDQAILEQLATLASVTVEKARLYASEARQEAARFRDDLLAGMSHDMQTPLSVIVGIADSLSEEPDLPVDERVPIYDTIARQARRLRSLVNQFLDFSRIEADRPLTLDVQAVDVVEVIDHVVPLFTHQREMIVGAEGDLPNAYGDRERLEQVLVNLISNAVKYSDAPVRVVARIDAGRVIIDVVDEGPGMSESELEQVFEKFQRGSASHGVRGTGLGLYISRALTEAQGGTLTASSRSGMGSRFRVSLSIAP